MPQKKRSAADYPKRGVMPQKTPALPYDPRSISEEEARFNRIVSQDAERGWIPVLQDEYGYVSPNRAKMQELLAGNINKTFPARTDVPSEYYTKGFFGDKPNPKRDLEQNQLYQAQLIMDALEQARAAKKGGRRTP